MAECGTVWGKEYAVVAEKRGGAAPVVMI